MRHFRERLREALKDVCEAGGHAAVIDPATDVVRPLPEGAAPQNPGLTLPKLPLRPVPRVSDEAKQRYTEQFGRHDVETCIGDWHAWLRKSGKTAERPDAAFLGFARKWKPRTS